MVDKIQLEDGLELWKVPISELKEQDINARSMPKIMFDRLSETIGRDKRLEALPFVGLTDKGLEIISGHHRVRAAKSAGLSELFILVDVTGLNKSQIKAKQLAHNSIGGIDDKAILQQIYDQLETVDDIRESFVDAGSLEELNNVKIDEVLMDNDVKSVSINLVPNYYDRWEDLIERQKDWVSEIDIADIKYYEDLHEALKRVSKNYNIKNISALICKFIDLADGLKTQVGWMGIVDIFGPEVPREVGEMLLSVVDTAIKNGDITEKNKWQILEYVFADYLAGK
jgi:hypothetical protein